MLWLPRSAHSSVFLQFCGKNRARTSPDGQGSRACSVSDQTVGAFESIPLLEYNAWPAVLIYAENFESEHVITDQVVNWIHVQKFVWFKKVAILDRRQNMEKLLHKSIKSVAQKTELKQHLCDSVWTKTAHSESRNLAVNGMTAVWNCCGRITQHRRKSGSVNSGGKTLGNDFIYLIEWFDRDYSLFHTTGVELRADKLLARNVPVTLAKKSAVPSQKQQDKVKHLLWTPRKRACESFMWRSRVQSTKQKHASFTSWRLSLLKEGLPSCYTHSSAEARQHSDAWWKKI